MLCAWFTGVAWSLDRDLSLEQLNHRRWLARDNAPADITAFAQTPDGALWMGTSKGLFWTDGMAFDAYAVSGEFRLPSSNVSTLHAAQDGSLWLGYQLGGITRIRQRTQLTHFNSGEGLPAGEVHAIVHDAAGVLWSATDGGLARFVDDRWQPVSQEWALPAGAVLAALADRQGVLWVTTRDAVFTLLPRQSKFQLALTLPRPIKSAGGLAQAPDGGVWLSAAGLGVIRVDGPSRAHVDVTAPGQIIFDRDGSLWIAGAGLRRLTHPGTPIETFARPQGLSANVVNSVFEDREGNVWIGTVAGMDRLTNTNVVRMTLPWSSGYPTLVAGEHGSVWIGGSEANALLRFDNGKLSAQLPAPAFTASTRGRSGNIWFGGADGVARVHDHRIDIISLPAAVRGNDVQAMVEDHAGALWVAIAGQPVFRYIDGAWIPYGGLAELPHTSVLSAAVDADGNVWFGYADGRLARVNGPQVRVFNAEALNIGAITALSAKDSMLWVGGEVGLIAFQDERFEVLQPRSCQPYNAVSGIVETATGDVWLFRGAGLTRIETAREQLRTADPPGRVWCGTFGRYEGIPGSARQLRPTPSMVETSDGHLWLSASDGLAWLDPRRLQANPSPPAAAVVHLVVSGARFSADVGPIELPVHTRNLLISYTAWNLTLPEQVRFRYWLEGSDEEWRTVGRVREAAYTNLGPGSYRFHLVASNDGEVWGASEAVMDFAILPAFYQTRWFMALCVLAASLSLVAFFRLQMRRAALRMRVRLEERMVERERIARELHDTLLQGLQGLIMRFHSVALRIPEREQLRELMERALERADQVLIESRDKVMDLRDVSGGDSDLSQDIVTAGQQMDPDSKSQFSVTVNGTKRALHVIVREETFLITREALVNAFAHAEAAKIEVELFYERGSLRINVRDDGRGIDADLLTAGGRDGHWGLLGMRERAGRIGATLEIYSRANAGTEVQLRVPAALAYRDRRNPLRWPLVRPRA